MPLFEGSKGGVSDMRKRHATLIILIAAIVSVLSSPASAKGGSKASSNLLNHTATGEHYKNTTLTPKKPKPTVTKKPAGNVAADKDKDIKPFIKIEPVEGESTHGPNNGH